MCVSLLYIAHDEHQANRVVYYSSYILLYIPCTVIFTARSTVHAVHTVTQGRGGGLLVDL